MAGRLNRAGNRRGMSSGSRGTQFQTGDDWRGNAGGMPKGSVNLTGRVIRALLRKAKGGDADVVADQIAERIIVQMARGNAPIIREVWNRLEGPIVAAEEPEDLAEKARRLRETLLAMDEATIGADDGVEEAPEAR